MNTRIARRLFFEYGAAAGLYDDSRLFRNAVTTGGAVTLFITLIGLIGYLNDEVRRRSKEIALRKINGATPGEMIALLSRSILLLALPALAIGSACAYAVGQRWLMNFPDKIALSPWMFLCATGGLLLVIGSCMVLRSWHIARQNPAKSVKTE